MSLSTNTSALWFQHLSDADGLSQVNGRAIVQDNSGLLYIGTQEGLNIYDGNTVESLYRDESTEGKLVDDDIYALALDGHNHIWIGSNKYLQRYDVKRKWFDHFPIQPITNQGKGDSFETVTNILIDSEQRIWFSIKGFSGIALFDEFDDNPKIKYFSPDLNLDLKSIVDLEWKHDEILISTVDNIFQFSPQTKKFSVYSNWSVKNQGDIKSIRYEENNGLYVSTNAGLFVDLDNLDEMVYYYAADLKDGRSIIGSNVNLTFRDSKGHLWVGTTEGVSLFDPVKSQFQDYKHEVSDEHSLIGSVVENIFEDRAGNIWFSTQRGLSRLELSGWKSYLFHTENPKSLSNGSVWQVVASRSEKNILWISTSSGLNKYNTVTGEIKHYFSKYSDVQELPSMWFISILENDDGSLWLGSRNSGVVKFNPKELSYKHYEPNNADNFYDQEGISRVYAICKDAHGQVWIGGFDGLYKYDAKKDQFVAPGNDLLSGISVFSIISDEANGIWIGTKTGVFHYDYLNNKIKRYVNDKNNEHSLSSNLVFSLYRDDESKVWVGTGDGVNVIADDVVFRVNDNLEKTESHVILSVVEDDKNRIWASTNDGIIKIEKDNLKQNRYLYKGNARFSEYVINSALFYDKKLYFGGIDGVVFFSPDMFDYKAYSAPVIFRDLLVANIPVSVGEYDNANEIHLPLALEYLSDLEIPGDISIFGFSVANDHYGATEHIRYQYRLLGFYEKWIKLARDQNTITFTNIDPGSYVFQIYSVNEQGMAGALRELEIKILPRIWNTWWAYLIYFSIISTVIALIAVQRQQKTQTDKLMQASQQRLREFVANSTDGIWSVRINPAVSVALPVAQQIEMILNSFELTEYNNSLKNMCDENLWRKVPFESENIHEFLNEWIKQGYRVGQQLSHSAKFWHSSAYVGEIQDGELIGISGTRRDISEQHRNYRNVQHIAAHDSLTKLKNRYEFNRCGAQLLNAGMELDIEYAVVILDLNNFKEINDTLGHHYGDLLLKKLSERLLERLPIRVLFARFGGDEFIFMHPVNQEDSQFYEFIDQLKSILSEPFDIDDALVDVSGSVGVAISDDSNRDLEKLISKADSAMYISKRKKIWVTYYSELSDLEKERSVNFFGGFGSALSNDQLELYYQPIVDVQSGEITSVEALIRWNHPDYGFLLPDKFIPLVEKTTYIQGMTLWVIKSAIEEQKRLKSNGFDINISVNISALNLYDPEFIDRLKNIVDNNLDKRICLEITESVLVDDVGAVVEKLNIIKNLGFTLAIDDFGVGYSSLAYLKNLPVNWLKIDKQFIRDASEDKRGLEVIKWIVDLAHMYKLKVIAEGIEEGDILKQLKKFGCDYFQGFYFYRPASQSVLEKNLNERCNEKNKYSWLEE